MRDLGHEIADQNNERFGKMNSTQEAKKLLLSASRQHRHNFGSEEYIPAYDYEETQKLVSELINEKDAEIKRLREENKSLKSQLAEANEKVDIEKEQNVKLQNQLNEMIKNDCKDVGGWMDKCHELESQIAEVEQCIFGLCELMDKYDQLHNKGWKATPEECKEILTMGFPKVQGFVVSNLIKRVGNRYNSENSKKVASVLRSLDPKLIKGE